MIVPLVSEVENKNLSYPEWKTHPYGPNELQVPLKSKIFGLSKHCCLFNSVIYYTLMHPKDADGISNSVDSDQTAPEGKCGEKVCLVQLASCL